MDITPKGAKCQSTHSSLNYSVESSPSEFKEKKHHPKLSASLRERLKRTRRSFVSPLSVAKRLCVDDEEEEDGRQVSAHSLERSGSEKFPGYVSKHEDLVKQLRKEVKDKTETLRRLKMVKMYRSKNDLTQLQTLIDKWRSCAQAALCELQADVPIDGQKPSLSELIDLFGLDDSLLHFDRTEGDFTT